MTCEGSRMRFFCWFNFFGSKPKRRFDKCLLGVWETVTAKEAHNANDGVGVFKLAPIFDNVTLTKGYRIPNIIILTTGRSFSKNLRKIHSNYLGVIIEFSMLTLFAFLRATLHLKDRQQLNGDSQLDRILFVSDYNEEHTTYFLYSTAQCIR